MRYMVLVKATPESESGAMPSAEDFEAMNTYNQELAKAGVLVAGEGLHPSSEGAIVRFDGKDRTVLDGPFTETKELVAGFWIFDVKSKRRTSRTTCSGWCSRPATRCWRPRLASR